MLRMRNNNNNNKTNGFSPMNGSPAGTGAGAESRSNEWEMRPGGMLVQKRTADSDRNSALVPTIRVRVKHGSIYHGVNISSQATFGLPLWFRSFLSVILSASSLLSFTHIYLLACGFAGELKKMLSAPTGSHHEEQKIFFKDNASQKPLQPNVRSISHQLL